MHWPKEVHWAASRNAVLHHLAGVLHQHQWQESQPSVQIPSMQTDSSCRLKNVWMQRLARPGGCC